MEALGHRWSHDEIFATVFRDANTICADPSAASLNRYYVRRNNTTVNEMRAASEAAKREDEHVEIRGPGGGTLSLPRHISQIHSRWAFTSSSTTDQVYRVEIIRGSRALTRWEQDKERRTRRQSGLSIYSGIFRLF